jgi:protein-L-isoaspartate(D-aspartate) O-methyltransferase
MTDLLGVGPGDHVLELGTGSGYQAAVLAALGCEVFSVEIVPELQAIAAERLRRLGYRSVETRSGDGYHGWSDQAPFDAVVVTAASSHVPPPLVAQLKPGGRIVIPLGNPFLTQRLSVVEKDLDGAVRTRQLLPVVFVPLTGGH